MIKIIQDDMTTLAVEELTAQHIGRKVPDCCFSKRDNDMNIKALAKHSK